MNTKYDDYLASVSAREMAEEWNDLPNGHKYQNATMKISTAHCRISLVRAGQQSQGGKNYWESPGELNAVLLEVIAEDGTVIERAIEKLKVREKQAPIDCWEFANGILEKIGEVG